MANQNQIRLLWSLVIVLLQPLAIHAAGGGRGGRTRGVGGIPGVRQRHREGDEIGTVNVILVVILPVLQMILVLLVIALLRICYVKYLKTKNEDEKIEPKLIQVVVSAQDMEKKKKLSIENNLG